MREICFRVTRSAKDCRKEHTNQDYSNADHQGRDPQEEEEEEVIDCS